MGYSPWDQKELNTTERVSKHKGTGNKYWCLVPQSCPTFCDPVDCSPPGSSVHGAFQARILEWVAISFSMGSSPPRDQTQVSHTAGRLFTILAITATPKSADPLRKRSCWRKLTFLVLPSPKSSYCSPQLLLLPADGLVS